MPIARFELNDGRIARFEVPDGTTPEQAQAFMSSYFSGQEQTQPSEEEIGYGEEFVRGIQRGAENTASLITEGVPALTKSVLNKIQSELGFDPSFDPTENLTQYQKELQETFAKYPTKFESISNIEDLTGALHFVSSAAGETLPSLVSTMVGGGIGGMATKQGIKALAKRGGKELLEKEINKAIIKGTLLGSTAIAGPQNVSETYLNLLQGGEDAPMTALVTGGLKSALDTYTPSTLLGKVFGAKEASELIGKSLMKKVGIEGIKSAGFEGLTESAQEALDIFAEQVTGVNQGDIFSKENILRLADSGIKGAIGGGLAGAASSPFIQVEGQGKEYKPSEKSSELLDTEEVLSGIQGDPTNDTIISPAYVEDTTKQTIKEYGLEEESFNKVSPQDIEDLATEVQTPTMEPTQTQKIDQKKLEEVQERQRIIKEPTPIEGMDFTSFVLGDGVINDKAVTNPTSTLTKPETLIKVSDPFKLEFQTKDPPMLPKNLQGAKPRFKTSELVFPSDLEKALYIAGSKQKSKSKDSYTNWLKDIHGLTDQQIKKHSADLRKNINKKHTVLKNPEVLEVPEITVPTTKPKAQRGYKLPFYGDFYQDYTSPKEIIKGVNGLELTPKATEQYKDLINLSKRIVKEVAGPNLQTKFFQELSLGPEYQYYDPIKGAQFNNVVAVALNNNVTPESVTETSYHEAIHAIYNFSFNANEKTILLENTNKLREYALKDDYLKNVDFDQYLLTEEGKEELIVNSLAKMMTEQRLNPKSLNQFPNVFKRAFLRVKNYLQRLGNGLRGLGFITENDIFNSIVEGKRAKDIIDDSTHQMAMARYQRLAKSFKDVHDNIKEPSFKELAEDAKQQSNYKTQPTGKGMGIYGRSIRSIVDLASKDPFAAIVYDSVRRKLNNASNLLKSYVTIQKNFGNQAKDARYRIYELANEMRGTNQKAYLDEDGLLNFKRGDQTLRLKNKEISQAYIDLQNTYKKVISDWKDELVLSGSKTFKNILPERKGEYTKMDFQVALDSIDKTTAPETHVRLTNFIEALEATEKFSLYDFAPRMRFGSNGIAVKDTEGETIAFYTIEGGSFNNLYNEYQLTEAIKEIKEKYGDSELYSVYDANGKVKNLSKDRITPFTMTNNELKNHINTRFLNLESLSSLLFSKDMNQEAYAEMRQEVYNDILEKGFKKRFSESKNIDGYSKDWDRVHHAYLSGASHYLAGLPHQEELSTLQVEATKLADPKLKEKLLNYMDYVNSPQEDWQAARTLNFMWTMGGNISTAIMQVMTLPTTTLGVMTQYNPNVLQNMRYIGKWSKRALPFIINARKTITLEDGSFSVDFADTEILDGMIKRGEIDEETRQFIEKTNKYGLWAGLLTEESVGYKPFETRSLGGSRQEKLSNVGQLLGMPTNAMEQMTRFATTMASFEMLKNNKKAQDRMQRILKEDYRFQAQLRNQKDMSFIENAALFNMDEAHAVFGKLGRVEYQRGIGGALFFPFMTYPHQMLELLGRMYGRSAEGKRALATTITAMFLLGGLVGLPGGELLKELMEAIQMHVTGVEDDYDLLIREAIYKATGSTKFGKAITQGVGRAYLGMDVSKRVGLPIPGQELLLTMLGIKGESSDILGVQGSILSGIGQAWNEYNQGSGAVNVLQAVTPVAASNLLKAYTYADKGARTRAGLQIVRPEDMKASSVMARALGITTDQIATGREALYYSNLTQNKYKTGITRFRKKAQNIVTDMTRAQKNKDFDKAKELRKEYSELMKEFQIYLNKYKIQQDLRAFNKSVMNRAQQRVSPKVNFKDIKKSARKDVNELLKALGVN